MAHPIELRDIIESDLPIFYRHQTDPVALAMVAFVSRPEAAFMDHWHKIMRDSAITGKTVLYNGEVAGNILCFPHNDELEIGYWYGREYWGKGIATAALTQFLATFPHRPLRATVSQTNPGSQHVLEKCGFVVTGEESWFSDALNQEIRETNLVLE